MRFSFLILLSCIKLQIFATPDTTVIPDVISKQLITYKHQNKLIDWLYTRISFTDKNVTQRLPFFMLTQQQAWRAPITLQEKQEWFNMLTLQGYYQLQNSNILASISAYEAALQYFEKEKISNEDVVEFVLKPLGNCYTRLADYSRAIYIHEKALKLAIFKNNKQYIAASYANLAACARWQGNLNEARTFCNYGIAITTDVSLQGLLLTTYADVFQEKKMYDSAAFFCSKALLLLKRNLKDEQEKQWYCSALHVMASIQKNKRNYKLALHYVKQETQYLRSFAGIRTKAKALLLTADIYLANNQPKQALTYYHKALQLFITTLSNNENLLPEKKYLYAENTIADAIAGKANALKLLGKNEEALQHYLLSFTASKILRDAFYYTSSKLQELALTRKNADAAIVLAYRMYDQTKNKNYADVVLLIAEFTKAQLLADERTSRNYTLSDSNFIKQQQLQQAINYYKRELATDNTNNALQNALNDAEYNLSLISLKNKINSSNYLSLTEISKLYKAIPGNITVIEFYANDTINFFIEIDNTGIKKIQKLNDLSLLKNVSTFMQQWFYNGPAAMQNYPSKYVKASNEIYKSLFNDYNWKADKHYIIIPDNELSYLPFEGLSSTTSKANYLFYQAIISQAYSLQTWQQQQSATYNTKSFTGFFISETNKKTEATLNATTECTSLQKLIKGDFYLNQNATYSKFISLNDPCILHISTHAFSTASDSLSYFKLYDKPYYLFDLQYRSLNTALVVLSACKSGNGAMLQGEGINSLSRSFTSAGVGGVISGLWNINDETVITLNNLFYKELLSGNDAATALHNAKLKWLKTNSSNATQQLPYYWSGIIYSGQLQKIQLEKKADYRYWIISGAIGLAAISFIFLLHKRKRFNAK